MKQLLKITAFLLFAQLSKLQAQTSNSPLSGRQTWGLTTSMNPGLNLDDARLSLGVNVIAERRLNDLLGATFSAGFTSNATKKFISIGDQNLIPLKAGVKIYGYKDYFLAGDVGLAIDINGNSSTAWSATLAKKVSSRLDMGLKLDNYFFDNFLSLSLGYRIF